MSKNKLALIVIALSVIIIGGLFISNSDNQQTNTQNNSIKTNEDTSNPIFKTSKITGSLTFPSERIPNPLKVCAENIDNNRLTCTEDQIKGSQFIYDKGYELVLSPGKYFVFAQPDQNTRAYHNKYVQEISDDGQWPDYDSNNCSSFQPLELNVADNEVLSNITVGDWYYQENCEQ